MKKYLATTIVIVAIIGLLVLLRHSSSDDAAALSPTTPTSTSSASTSATPVASTNYKDGTYTGDASDNRYGTVQVSAVISGGKLTDVKFLQMPSDRDHSAQISSFASPELKQEALAAQSAHVDGVSGATSTSESFVQSLQSALNKASA